MNKAILMGRLTRDPEIRYSNGPEQTAVGRFTLAVDRRGQRQGESAERRLHSVRCLREEGGVCGEIHAQGNKGDR